jgi:hypothetical protein
MPRLESTAFKGAERVGDHKLARLTGEYDLFGNQVYSAGVFDTVRRFKGLWSAVIRISTVGSTSPHIVVA